MGVVTGFDRKGALIDLGSKSPAVCAVTELSLARVDKPEDVVAPGEAREFAVMREDQKGVVHLSIRKVEEKLLWHRLRQMYEEQVSMSLVCVWGGRERGRRKTGSTRENTNSPTPPTHPPYPLRPP